MELAKPINSNKYPPMVLFNTIAKNTSKAEVIVTVKKAFRRLTLWARKPKRKRPIKAPP